jgi:tripartite-type tricarboxylate transporter receptor subunit TctC
MMKTKLPHRRRFLHLAAGAVALPAVSRTATAQIYPGKPVRIVVGVVAGSTSDILARLMGQWLSERLGRPFIVENRPGAGGNVGVEAVARAAADGYTLLLVAPNVAINTTLYDKLNFDFIRDIAPVAGVLRVPNVLEVNPSVPAKTIPEFIAHAKAHPRTINMASPGIGTTPHVAGELFNMMAGVHMVHVPYRGGAPALSDLIAGQVQVMFDNTGSSIGHIRACTGGTMMRAGVLPDLPTVADFLPGFEASAWFGVGAPRNTPTDIIEKLNGEINSGLADAKNKARLTDLGGTALVGSPSDFGKLIAGETEKWAKVIKFAGIQPMIVWPTQSLTI